MGIRSPWVLWVYLLYSALSLPQWVSRRIPSNMWRTSSGPKRTSAAPQWTLVVAGKAIDSRLLRPMVVDRAPPSTAAWASSKQTYVVASPEDILSRPVHHYEVPREVRRSLPHKVQRCIGELFELIKIAKSFFVVYHAASDPCTLCIANHYHVIVTMADDLIMDRQYRYRRMKHFADKRRSESERHIYCCYQRVRSTRKLVQYLSRTPRIFYGTNSLPMLNMHRAALEKPLMITEDDEQTASTSTSTSEQAALAAWAAIDVELKVQSSTSIDDYDSNDTDYSDDDNDVEPDSPSPPASASPSPPPSPPICRLGKRAKDEPEEVEVIVLDDDEEEVKEAVANIQAPGVDVDNCSPDEFEQLLQQSVKRIKRETRWPLPLAPVWIPSPPPPDVEVKEEPGLVEPSSPEDAADESQARGLEWSDFWTSDP